MLSNALALYVMLSNIKNLLKEEKDVYKTFTNWKCKIR